MVLILAVALVVFQTLMFAASPVVTQPNIGSKIPIFIHVIIVLLAILSLAICYCFRYPAWEKSVAELPKEEEKEVTELSQKANIQDSDSEGNKL